jgi:hypothetical protein
MMVALKGEKYMTRVIAKNVKINDTLSDETLCFSATIYVDGKRTAIASNRGCGGENEYHIIDADRFDCLRAIAKDAPAETVEMGGKTVTVPVDVDALVYLAVEDADKLRNLRNAARRSIVFRTAEGEWRWLSGKGCTKEELRKANTMADLEGGE